MYNLNLPSLGDDRIDLNVERKYLRDKSLEGQVRTIDSLKMQIEQARVDRLDANKLLKIRPGEAKDKYSDGRLKSLESMDRAIEELEEFLKNAEKLLENSKKFAQYAEEDEM